MEDEAQLNPFGEAMQRFMNSRGISSVEELVERLREAGYDTPSVEEIRLWMEADPRFLHIADDWQGQKLLTLGRDSGQRF